MNVLMIEITVVEEKNIFFVGVNSSNTNLISTDF